MSRKNRNLKYNPRLAHKENIRELKSSKFEGKKDFGGNRGGFSKFGKNNGKFGGNRGGSFGGNRGGSFGGNRGGSSGGNRGGSFGGNRGGNFKKSGFNRSERPSKNNKNRPGKVQRLKDRNKKKSFGH